MLVESNIILTNSLEELMIGSNFIGLLLIIVFSMTFKLQSAETASPYDLGQKLFPYSESDLFKNEKQLAAIIEKRRIHTIIEIGCWFGESTIFMAGLLPDNGKVYAIDSWIGYPRETYQITRYVYERFLSNVVHAGLTDRIIPIRMTSLSANRIFTQYRNKKVDMVYIDGDHAYEAVYSDIKAWSPYVRTGGVLCGNLYAKNEKEMHQIKKAVQDFCEQDRKTVSFDGYFWKIRL